jgi:hypothetical protein
METETETISRWRMEAYQEGYRKALMDMSLTLSRAMGDSPVEKKPIPQAQPEQTVEHSQHHKSKGWTKLCWRKVFGEYLKVRILRMVKSGMSREQIIQSLISEVANSHGLNLGITKSRMERLITVSVLSRFADMSRGV